MADAPNADGAATDVAATNSTGAEYVLVQRADHNVKDFEKIIVVAKEISKYWPEVRERVKQRSARGDSSFSDAENDNIEKLDHLISLLTQTAVARENTSGKEPRTHEKSALPLQRFLAEADDDWEKPVRRDLDNDVPVSSEIEGRAPQKDEETVSKRSASPSASFVSLVADSALSTVVSDDTVVLDSNAMEKNQLNRQSLDALVQRNLNEKLCRIVTSGQATKIIIARATDLIGAGADVNARDEWCDGTIYDKSWVHYQSRDGWLRPTVLYGAVAAKADCDVIRLLLNNGADINKIGGFSDTPLRAIVGKDEKHIVRLLLNRGADINATRSPYGCSTLHQAVRYGTIGTVEMLLDRGANIMDADSLNRTPLRLAADRGHVGMIKLLLDRGADLDTQEKDTGLTPLGGALHMAHEGAVAIQLARGADVTLLPPVLKTYADAARRANMMGMLKEYGAEYTCATLEDVPRVYQPVPTYELVRAGSTKETARGKEKEQQHKELTAKVEKEEKTPTNGGSSVAQQNSGVDVQANTNNETNQTTQNDETASVISYQTNSTNKTETKRRKKFWSRFSSQTTLQGSS